MLKPTRKLRKRRIRGRMTGTNERPRVSVFRSNKYMAAQIIDDEKGITLAAVHEKELEKAKGTKLEKATLLGEMLAEKAAKAKIKKVVFDRSGYKYHGRVKAVAESLRAKGVEV